MRLTAIASVLLLSACVSTAPPQQPQTTQRAVYNRSPAEAVAMLDRVVARVEPVAERECRARTQGIDCDLSIFIDNDPSNPPNAMQTLDGDDNPVIIFTMALARNVENEDELAFVLGHEAAHHIAGHIPRARERATVGVLAGALTARILGLDEESSRAAQRLGGFAGARSFSPRFELQADQIGTIIAARAGYDPVRGAQYFTRIPDPGNQFLGTHPPNADRIRIVRETAATL